MSESQPKVGSPGKSKNLRQRKLNRQASPSAAQLDPHVRLDGPHAETSEAVTVQVRGGKVYETLKRCFDIAFSLAVLTVVAPVTAVIAALVKIDSPGPAFFTQNRCGKDGKLFQVYKLRTMFSDADTYGESPRDDRKDVRVTRIGYFLRRTSLDELPQFWCVLKGDMSVVGPRPEMKFIVDQYTPRMKQRLLVTPGITGPWQVSDARKEPIHEHLEYDLYYLENRSLWLDAKVISQTGSLVFHAVKNSLLNRAHLQKI